MSGSRVLYDYEATRYIDERTANEGFPEIQLMGQAALASLQALLTSGRLSRTGRLFLLCGTGNNGGDALAFVYMLLGYDRSFRSRVHVFQTAAAKTPNARFYEGHLKRLGLPLLRAADFDAARPGPDDLLLEALLGTGQSSPPREPALSLLRKVRELRATRPCPAYIALDVPAGLTEKAPARFGAPGEVGHDFDFAAPDEIHSYGVAKLALRLHHDLASCSRVLTLPMGFDPDALEVPSRTFLPEAPKKATFFRKGPTMHKYSAGHGVLIGGSKGMEGAILLAANSFFSAGGGILHVFLPEESSREFLTARHPHIMFHSLERPWPSGLKPASIAVGPGLSADDLSRMRERLLTLLKEMSAGRVILDAGALELVRDGEYPDSLKERTLITPHAGEWKRLGGPAIGDTAGVYAALGWNRTSIGCHSLVKDCVSALLAPSGTDALVFSNPNPSLAVAGSGDVLTGILLAVFARRREREPGMAELAAAAQQLHTAAAGRMLHASADEFPDLLREVLGGDDEL